MLWARLRDKEVQMDAVTIINIIVGICNVLALLTAIVVAVLTIKHFRVRNAYDLWMKSITGEHLTHALKVRERLETITDPKTFVQKIETNEELKKSVYYLIDHWTVLGTGIRFHILDSEAAVWMNYQQVIYFFEKLQPWIVYRRSKTSETNVFHDFTWLYLLCKKEYSKVEKHRVDPAVYNHDGISTQVKDGGSINAKENT